MLTRPTVHKSEIDQQEAELESMEDEPDKTVTKTMAIPAWMVYGAMMLITVLLGGPVGQLVMVSHHVYENHREQAKVNLEISQRIGNNERDISMQKQKQDDILHAVKAQDVSIQELNRNVAVLISRKP